MSLSKEIILLVDNRARTEATESQINNFKGSAFKSKLYLISAT